MDGIESASRILLASENSSVIRSRNEAQEMPTPLRTLFGSISLSRTRSLSHSKPNCERQRSISLSPPAKVSYGTSEDLFFNPLDAGSSLKPPRTWCGSLAAGLVAFLLSSTIAVSSAGVVVGHGTILSRYVSHFIDMNFLGSALLCFFLSWQSTAPWALGAIDVFVAPIMNEMAIAISEHLNNDMHRVVPTVIVMVAMTSALLGLAIYLMGVFRMTTIANYLPFPVIAGFLAGVGATLLRNGIHMATGGRSFLERQGLLLVGPALAFGIISRWVQYKKCSVAFALPVLLSLSVIGYHLTTFFLGFTIEEGKKHGWLYSWSDKILDASPMWLPWNKVNFGRVHWHTILTQSGGYFISLLFLGGIKYSVFTSSISTVVGQKISADAEMRVIGQANMIAGVLGCNGGCHYLSAMGMLQVLDSFEKIPALVCGVMFLLLWFYGFTILTFVPKFVYGGLLLNIGMHFIEGYLLAPCNVISNLEALTICIIMICFLVVGMLPSVALGILLSALILVYQIHAIGCIRAETTGKIKRSVVDRTSMASTVLDDFGDAIHILRLQGHIFFGTSVKILTSVENRVLRHDIPPMKFLVIDFSLVPSFDATALKNFSQLTTVAETTGFQVYFCGAKADVYAALRRNPASSVINFEDDLDSALEICEDALLPRKLLHQTPLNPNRDVVDLWYQFLREQDYPDTQKLIPIACYLDAIVIMMGDSHKISLDTVDTFFICEGIITISTESKSGQVCIRKACSGSVFQGREHQWDAEDGGWSFHMSISTVLLGLSHNSLTKLSETAPNIAIEMMKFIQYKQEERFRQSDRRIMELSTWLSSS